MKSGRSLWYDAVAADLAHQVHAHRVAAEREEQAVAERQDAGVAPDQVHRQRDDRVAHDLADQRARRSRETCSALSAGTTRFSSGHDARAARAQRRRRAAQPLRGSSARAAARRRRVQRTSSACASSCLRPLRPFSANRPCGRFWMKTMMNTSTAIFASTAPASASRNLLTMPRPERRVHGAGELADAAEHDDHERVDDVALARGRARRCRSATARTPPSPAMPEPRPNAQHVDARRAARRCTRPCARFCVTRAHEQAEPRARAAAATRRASTTTREADDRRCGSTAARCRS